MGGSSLGFPSSDRAIRESATPYLDGAAQWLGRRMDLVPSVETINKAFTDYVEQAKQADRGKRIRERTIGRIMLELVEEARIDVSIIALLCDEVKKSCR